MDDQLARDALTTIEKLKAENELLRSELRKATGVGTPEDVAKVLKRATAAGLDPGNQGGQSLPGTTKVLDGFFKPGAEERVGKARKRDGAT